MADLNPSEIDYLASQALAIEGGEFGRRVTKCSVSPLPTSNEI